MNLSRPPHVEQRETERSYLHRLDSEYAWILSRSGERKARVLDITPKGIGLVLEGASARMPLLLEKGDLVPIRMERGGQEVLVKARLATRSETLLEKDTLRLGFRIESDDEVAYEITDTGKEKAEQPRPHRFSLKDAPLLECESDDPSRYGQRAFYKIRDLSMKGALLETSARNKFLLPNLKLWLSIAVPGHGRFIEQVMIRRVQSAQDRYLVGIEFLSLQEETIKAFGDFCVNFAKDVSYQIMLEEGFPAAVLEDSLTVQTMASQQDFMQITQLRLHCEHDAGRSLELADPWAMMESEDNLASHVSVKLGKRVVASARLIEVDEFSLKIDRIVLDKDFKRAVKGPKVESVLWRGIFRAALLSEKSAIHIIKEKPALAWPEGLQKLGTEEGLTLRREDLILGRKLPFALWSRYLVKAIEQLSEEQKLTITNLTHLKIWVGKRLGLVPKIRIG